MWNKFNETFIVFICEVEKEDQESAWRENV
jgi:hypothetical protein